MHHKTIRSMLGHVPEGPQRVDTNICMVASTGWSRLVEGQACGYQKIKEVHRCSHVTYGLLDEDTTSSL